MLGRLKALPRAEVSEVAPVAEEIEEEIDEDILDVLPTAEVGVFDDPQQLDEFHEHLFTYGEFAAYRFEDPFVV